jgi:hypothetical protein
VDLGSGFGANVTFEGNVTNCPRCGGMAAIADFHSDSKGRVTWLDGAFSALTRAGIGRVQWKALIDALEQAQFQKLTTEQTTAKIAEQAPELAEALRVATPKDAAAFWTMISALLFLLHMLLDRGNRPAERTQIINQVTNYITQSASKPDAVRRVPVGTLTRKSQPRAGKKRTEVGSSPKRAAAEGVPPKVRKKAWKNSRCRCGSGRRSKDCCGS